MLGVCDLGNFLTRETVQRLDSHCTTIPKAKTEFQHVRFTGLHRLYGSHNDRRKGCGVFPRDSNGEVVSGLEMLEFTSASGNRGRSTVSMMLQYENYCHNTIKSEKDSYPSDS